MQPTHVVKGVTELWPAAQLVQVTPSWIDPLLQVLSQTAPAKAAVQTHVPPVPVQAPLSPQLDWEQHMLLIQESEEHSVPKLQAPPSAVLLLHSAAPGELVGLASEQGSQSDFAELGMLLDRQLAHTAPAAEN